VEMLSLYALRLAKWSVSVAIVLEFLGILDVVHLLESGGGTLCHHHATRCFVDSAGPWAVCARCSGMYLGWLLPVALSPVMKSKRCDSRCLCFVTLLFLSAVVSALLERSGVFTTANTVRAILGIPLGILPAMMTLFAITRIKESMTATPPDP
jgi:uncharacterized membrane protein